MRLDLLQVYSRIHLHHGLVSPNPVSSSPLSPLPFSHFPTTLQNAQRNSVGKTSLMNRYSTHKFTGQYKATIGADFVSKECIVVDAFGQRHLVTLQIWDTAGQERFQSLGNTFYRGSDAAMLVYDITDPSSLDHLTHWQTEFLNQVGGGVGGAMSMSDGPSFPFVVVGNKCDKEQDRLVPPHRALEWCSSAQQQKVSTPTPYGCYGSSSPPLPHYDVSAKTAANVEDAFQELARLALQHEEHRRRSQPQLFVPPTTEPIDLRRQASSSVSDSGPPGCC